MDPCDKQMRTVGGGGAGYRAYLERERRLGSHAGQPARRVAPRDNLKARQRDTRRPSTSRNAMERIVCAFRAAHVYGKRDTRQASAGGSYASLYICWMYSPLRNVTTFGAVSRREDVNNNMFPTLTIAQLGLLRPSRANELGRSVVACGRGCLTSRGDRV